MILTNVPLANVSCAIAVSAPRAAARPAQVKNNQPAVPMDTGESRLQIFVQLRIVVEPPECRRGENDEGRPGIPRSFKLANRSRAVGRAAPVAPVFFEERNRPP